MARLETRVTERPESRDRHIPIIASSGLYLYQCGVCDEHRFVGVFRDTWERIPLTPRQTINVHWKSVQQITTTWRLRHPFIACPSRLIDRLASPDGLTAAIETASLTFLASAVDRLPDTRLGTLIARQLGHVYLSIVEDGNHLSGRSTAKQRSKVVSHLLADSWGFDVSGLHAWVANPQNREAA